jgi:DNA-binding PadR family transcriptional regulator
VYSIGVSNKDAPKADVLQGTLDIMILQTLAMLGPSHGYMIAARIEQVSGGRVVLNMGTLYPGLMRLEQRGAIRGRKQLQVEKQEWNRTVAIMQTLLNESK